MDIKATPKLSAGFMLYKGDGEPQDFFLFNVESGEIFQLNETSYELLYLCDGKNSFEAIFSQLEDAYDVEQQKLKDDFIELIAQWEISKILQ